MTTRTDLKVFAVHNPVLGEAGWEAVHGLATTAAEAAALAEEDGFEVIGDARVTDDEFEDAWLVMISAPPEPPPGISVVVSVNNGWSTDVIRDERRARNFLWRWGRDNLAADLGGEEYDTWLEALAALAARLAPEVPTLP